MASIVPGEPEQLTLLPTRTGDVRNLSQPGFNYDFAQWLPDGKRLLVIGNQVGKPSRNYLQDAAGGPPAPVTPEGVVGFLWVDEKSVAAFRDDSTWTLYPIDGGQPREMKAPLPIRAARSAATSGRYLFAPLRQDVPVKVYRFDSETGEKQLWKELSPTDRAGVYNLGQLSLTPDARWYVYSYVRDLSDLYMVEGLK